MEREDQKPPAPQITQETLSVYGTMLTWLFIATVLVVLLFIVPTALIYYNKWQAYTMLYVILAGALGGFISSLSRLYALRELPALLTNPHFKIIQNRYVAMYALIPPIVGIVAAAVVYMALAAGLIEGSLFPAFECSLGEGRCDKDFAGLFEWSPKGVRDHAKALVWGFISGFSERFFPGVIDTLSKR